MVFYYFAVFVLLYYVVEQAFRHVAAKQAADVFIKAANDAINEQRRQYKLEQQAKYDLFQS